MPNASIPAFLQPVMVEEPTPEEAVTWLHGLRGRYERFHGVHFTDAALITGEAEEGVGMNACMHIARILDCSAVALLR